MHARVLRAVFFSLGAMAIVAACSQWSGEMREGGGGGGMSPSPEVSGSPTGGGGGGAYPQDPMASALPSPDFPPPGGDTRP